MWILAFTVLISWASWKFIENPFRANKQVSKGKTISPFIVTGVATSIVICCGLVFHVSKGLPTRFDPELFSTLSIQNNDKDKENPCFLGQDEYYQNWGGQSCLKTIESAGKTLLLWGDSHALHLYDGLMHIQKDLNMNILVYASAGCSPMLDVSIPGNPQCRENNSQVKRIIKEYNVDSILMAGNWAWAFKVKDDNKDLSAVKETVTELKNMGVEVHVVNQVPLYPIANPQFLALRLAQANYSEPDFLFAPHYGTAAALQLAEILNDESFIDAYALMCPEIKLCSIYKDHKLMVVDNGHLSTAGSMQVASLILEKIN